MSGPRAFQASAQAVPLGPQSLTPPSPTHTPGTPVPVPPFRGAGAASGGGRGRGAGGGASLGSGEGPVCGRVRWGERRGRPGQPSLLGVADRSQGPGGRY